MNPNLAVKQLLDATPAVVAALPGGVHLVDIGPQSTPAAYANGMLLASIRIRQETSTPYGPASENPFSGRQQWRTPLALYFVHEFDYALIRAAEQAVLTVLNSTAVVPGLAGVGRILLSDYVPEVPNDAIQRAGSLMRFYVYHEPVIA